MSPASYMSSTAQVLQCSEIAGLIPTPLSFSLSTLPNMSVSVGRTPSALFQGESAVIDTWSAPTKNKDEELPDQSSIWTMIQSQKPTTPNVAAAPYVHPLVRRSVNLMGKSSLEICTESLGSETGSGDFSIDDRVLLNSSSSDEQVIVEHKKGHQQQVGGGEDDGNQIMSVNYQHSASQRSHTPRSFPPPLPSISCREGTCVQMRTRRQDGRLVVDAVPVASQINLHTRRQGGRLHLSFIDSTATTQPTALKTPEPLINKEDQTVKQFVPPAIERNVSQEDTEGDEEEVEVLHRGTMVEVKVSTQTQQPGSAKKVLRSSVVINKFVGGTPLTNRNRWAEPAEENRQSYPLAAWQPSLSRQPRLTATTTTTAAAAAVAASSASTYSVMMGQQLPLSDNKLLFTFKRRNREEMLHHMRRCSELRQPLFFWETGCIATSSKLISLLLS